MDSGADGQVENAKSITVTPVDRRAHAPQGPPEQRPNARKGAHWGRTTNVDNGKNPTVALLGPGPKGTRCRHCVYAVRTQRIGRRSKCTCTAVERAAVEQGEIFYVFRSWPSCSAYSGPSGEVEVTCPNCLRTRTVLRSSTDTSRHSMLCWTCGALEAAAKREGEPSQPVKKPPTYQGCRPVAASRGRCRGFDFCPGYDACLDYAVALHWSGWKSSKR